MSAWACAEDQPGKKAFSTTPRRRGFVRFDCPVIGIDNEVGMPPSLVRLTWCGLWVSLFSLLRDDSRRILEAVLHAMQPITTVRVPSIFSSMTSKLNFPGTRMNDSKKGTGNTVPFRSVVMSILYLMNGFF